MIINLIDAVRTSGLPDFRTAAFRMSRITRAFTLIELLVVIGIISILAGITMSSGMLSKGQAEIQVEQAANGVERMLLKARNLAITSGKPHCVVFHLENKGSGAILRNWDESDPKVFPGRHWCAIIGPEKGYDLLPRMSGAPESTKMGSRGSAQRFAATVQRAQIGEPFYLPRGTRFLALGDVEDNLHTPAVAQIPVDRAQYGIAATAWSQDTPTRTGIAALSTTYPRPWFGYLTGSGSAYTMRAFAGYDTTIYGSGLDYECTYRGANHDAFQTGNPGRPGVFRWNDAQTAIPVTNSTNAALCDCWYTPSNAAQTPARNSAQEEMRPCCDATQIGTPRPVLNGYWMDFAIVFLGDGQARALTFYNRAALYSAWAWMDATGLAAPKKIAQPQYGAVTSNYVFHGRDDGIIYFAGDAIGGPSVTVAKDAPDDLTSFTSPSIALKSLLPMRRIVVSEPTGAVRSIRPFASIQAWLDAIEVNVPTADRIWGNGWVYCAVTDGDANKIRV
ncbi:MAG: type II secretion system protein, partial [Planctomycetota bacterium]